MEGRCHVHAQRTLPDRPSASCTADDRDSVQKDAAPMANLLRVHLPFAGKAGLGPAERMTWQAGGPLTDLVDPQPDLS